MNIYLIANNYHFSKNKVKGIKVKESDLVIRLNKCFFMDIFNGKSDYIYMRTGGNNMENLWGIDKESKLISNRDVKKFKNKINFGIVCESQEYINKNKEKISIIESKNNIKFTKFIFYKNYQLEKSKQPSTGFVLLRYLLEEYLDANIYLVGFNFNNQSNSGWHDFKKEYDFVNELLKNNNKIHII